MSATPKTDALFFPYGRDATAAAEPSLLVCMTQYELLERELAALRLNLSVTMEELGEMRDRAEKAEADNATLREQLKDCSAVVDRQQKMLDRNTEQIASKQAQIDALMFEYYPEEMSLEQIMEWKKHQRPVVRYTFDGETNKLKSVEVIK